MPTGAWLFLYIMAGGVQYVVPSSISVWVAYRASHHQQPEGFAFATVVTVAVFILSAAIIYVGQGEVPIKGTVAANTISALITFAALVYCRNECRKFKVSPAITS